MRADMTATKDDMEMVSPFEGTEEEAKAYAAEIAADGWTVEITETRPEGTNRGAWTPRRFLRWPEPSP